MKLLLDDILYTLNQLPNRKVKGKDWTTYDLAKRVEDQLQNRENMLKAIDNTLSKLDEYAG